MSEYRLYLLDAAGHITGRVDLLFDSDEEAMATSRARFPDAATELWQGTRLVHSPSTAHGPAKLAMPRADGVGGPKPGSGASAESELGATGGGS